MSRLRSAEVNVGYDEASKQTDVPSWFLNNCVKTADDLAKEEPALLIRTSDAPNGAYGNLATDAVAERYEIYSVFYEFVRSALVTNALQTAAPNHKALYLRLLESQDDPLEARGFFSAVVHSLARDVEADLVTLGIDDMENLSEHYARTLKIPDWQEKDGLWPRLLLKDDNPVSTDGSGVESDKSLWIPLKLLVTAPQHRYPVEEREHPPSRVVLHIHGAYRFTLEPIGRNILRHLGRSITHELAETSVTIILTDSENSKCLQASGCDHSHHAEPKSMIAMTGFKNSSEVLWVPLINSSSLHETLEVDSRKERHRRHVDQLQKMTRRLKSVREGDDEEECTILQPYSSLGVLLQSQMGDVISETPSPYLAKCLAGVTDWSDPKDINDAILEAKGIQEALAAWAKTGNRDKYDSYEESVLNEDKWEQTLTPEARREAMRIKTDPYADKFEKKVLDLIVDTRSLEDTWSDIEIEPDLRQALVQMVNLCRSSSSGNHGILRNASAKGAVLYGPPGTGKTHLARVLAKESKSVMIHVSAADILHVYVGQSENFIKALFTVGRMVAPSIIFIDEADALLRLRREHDHSYQRSMISQFLQDSDGLKRIKNPPFLLLATNNPQDLDPAVLRRVPGRLYFGMPSCDARERIFNIFLRDECLSPSLSLRMLARKTARYTGSDIYTLCVNAALICQDEVMKTSPNESARSERVLMSAHFDTAFKRSGPTVQATALHKFRQFAHEYDPAAESKVMVQERADDHERFYLEEDMFRRRTVVKDPGKEKQPTGLSGSDSDDKKLYQPLDASLHEIRLLRIKTSGWATGKVECELQTVTLLDSPSFTAMSYVWGDLAFKEDILINGKSFPVTRNLARALRNIRQHWQEYFPDRDANEFRLWADAVCINQDDLVERNEQIQLMRDIYSSAELVISSLDVGEVANKLTEVAFDTYNAIYDVLIGPDGQERLSTDEMVAFEWLKDLPSLCVDTDAGNNLENNPWQAMDYFQAEHPYFRRVWILQEVVLAKNVILICNSYSIPFDKLVALGIVFESLPANVMIRPDFIPPRTWGLAQKFQAGTGLSTISLYNTIKAMHRYSEAYDVYDEDLAFSTLFLATGLLWLSASDPRDYFYGMLGLSKLEVVVDYEKSVAEVYRDFCQRRLEVTDTICKYHQHFLSHFSGVGFATPEMSKHQLPSWAPNFDVGSLFLMPQNAEDASSAFRQMRKMFAYQIKSTQWIGEGMQAQKGVFTSIPDAVPYIKDDFTLFIPGLNLQGVTKVYRFNQDEGAKKKGISKKFLQYCADSARRNSKHSIGKGKPWLMVILKTLVCDSRQSLGESCDDEQTREQAFILFMLLAQWHGEDSVGFNSDPWLPLDSSNFEAIYTHFQNLFLPRSYHQSKTGSERNDFEEVWNRGYYGLSDELEERLPTFPAVDNMVERIRAFSAAPWFETTDGYIGRGPPYMKVDDFVCIVKGCGLPILLRRSAQGQTHVGPCWVEGLMDGEAVDFLQDGRASLEWFEIR